jgi:hypothetical protein
VRPARPAASCPLRPSRTVIAGAVLDRQVRRLHNSVVDRPQTIIATRSRTATALALLLGAGGCFQSYAEADDGDVDAQIETDAAGDTQSEADVAVEADAEAEIDIGADADDGDAVADEGEADADTCAGGWYDPSSGLCWEDPPERIGRSWDDAVAYCDGLALGGRDDWFLPTIDELRSLIRNCPATETGGSCNVTAACLGPGCRNVECSGCAYGEGPGGAYWPAELHGFASWYWSSSRFTGDAPNAWHVDFDGAYVHREHISALFQARCVRPGP